MTADTKSLAEALPPLPETADELRAVAKELGAKARRRQTRRGCDRHERQA